MKNKIKTAISSFTFATLALILLLGPAARIQAQYTESTETEEQQVRTLVEKFNKSFEETKDIKKVPKELLIKDFRDQFAEIAFWFDGSDREFFNKLSIKERFESNAAVLNFVYLSVLLSYAHNVDINSDDLEEDERMAAIFPPEILAKINSHKLLRKHLFGGGEDEAVGSVKEFRSLQPGIGSVCDDIRRFLESNSSRGKWNEERKTNQSYTTEACSGEICHGFPEETPVHVFVSYPLVFEVYLENDAFKIADVGFTFEGD